MPQIEISDLTENTSPALDDFLHLKESGGNDRKVQLQNLLVGRVLEDTLSNLPTSGINVAIATDGRKDGETGGNGTGVLCYRISTTWYRVSDDTAVEI